MSCVPNVASVSILSIFDCPSFFSNVYLPCIMMIGSIAKSEWNRLVAVSYTKCGNLAIDRKLPSCHN